MRKAGAIYRLCFSDSWRSGSLFLVIAYLGGDLHIPSLGNMDVSASAVIRMDLFKSSAADLDGSPRDGVVFPLRPMVVKL